MSTREAIKESIRLKELDIEEMEATAAWLKALRARREAEKLVAETAAALDMAVRANKAARR